MTKFSTTATSALMATTFIASGAFADISKEEVLELFTTYAKQAGAEVVLDTTNNGKSITVNSISYAMDIPVTETVKSSVKFTVGPYDITEQGDGTVSISSAVPSAFSINTIGRADGENVEVNMRGTYDLTQSNTIVSGSVGDVTVTTTGAVKMALNELSSNQPAEDMPEKFEMSIALNGIDSKGTYKGTDTLAMAFLAAASNMTYTLAVSDPGEVDMNIDGSFKDVSFDLTSLSSAKMMAAQMSDMIKQGFSASYSVSHAGGNMSLVAVEGGETMRVENSSQSGALSASIDQDGMAYAIKSTGNTVQVTPPGMPFAFQGEVGEMGLGLKLPVIPSQDVVQDLNIALNINDLKIADMIWGMLDPAGKLPRDPMTVEIDIASKVKLFIDYMNQQDILENPAAMSNPGELHGFTLNKLLLKAAGAMVEGTGSFTFDNNDLESFDGMPRPEGAAEFNLSGVLGLVDTLIEMGLLPSDQAMGAKMFYGMFTVPTGDDAATTVLRVDENGAVYANDQRLR